MRRYGRWLVGLAVVVFLAVTVQRRSADVLALRFLPGSGAALALAAAATTIAHGWSAIVWGQLLRSLGLPVPRSWALSVYFTTNAAKYLPGNIWHFWGRILAVVDRVTPAGGDRRWAWRPAVLCVLLEPLVMAAAAGLLGLAAPLPLSGWLRGAIAIGILASLQPRWLNPLIRRLGRKKLTNRPAPPADSSPDFAPDVATAQVSTPEFVSESAPESSPEPLPLRLDRYPLGLLLGELGFVALRGLGFLGAIAAFGSIVLTDVPAILGGFSLAWLVGLVVPGAPGGLGVFEATAIGLLSGHLPPGVLVGGVAVYRLLSVTVEASLAGLAWLLGLKQHTQH